MRSLNRCVCEFACVCVCVCVSVHERQHPPHHEERTDAQLKQVCV